MSQNISYLSCDDYDGLPELWISGSWWDALLSGTGQPKTMKVKKGKCKNGKIEKTKNKQDLTAMSSIENEERNTQVV